MKKKYSYIFYKFIE